jgi:hypothetical protein
LPIPLKECEACGVRKVRLIGAGWALSTLVMGCQASVQAKAKTSGQVDASFDAAGPADSAERETEGVGPEADVPPAEPNGAATLLGARPDLSLASGGGNQACRCLSVAVGQPNDPAFAWQAGAPVTDPATQVVMALGSAATGCGQEPQAGIGASYWGYERVGADVVVVVENARAGRPMIQGAILPRPSGAGRIEIRPLDKQVSYGRSPDGSRAFCQLKLPTAG